jgi:hypothetical protein
LQAGNLLDGRHLPLEVSRYILGTDRGRALCVASCGRTLCG